MDDLARWLVEQLDEDERIARAAQRQRGGGQWAARADASGIVTVEGLPARPGEPIPVVLHPDEDETSVHVAEHDPTRVLREIDAKRRTVDLCAPPLVDVTGPGEPERSFIPGEGPPWGMDVLKLLALPYADRPGYREEWRP